MGLYDRDYTRDNYGSQYHHAPQMRFGFPKPTRIVKYLLIINVGVYVLSLISKQLGAFIYEWFELDAESPARAMQVWRLVSYQFLHSRGGVGHILYNMLGLYFLGPTLERHWGDKKFLTFYLGCGAAGGVFYLLLVAVGFLDRGVMVGASGAILGMLAACAILFPRFIVFLLFFPVPIRVVAFILTALYILALLARAENAGGDAAHLAGMGAGAGYVFSERWRARMKLKLRAGTGQRRKTSQRNLQVEVDRILKKVHDHGISSLTTVEKRTLKESTRAQQTQNHY